MSERTVLVASAHGLHARPASLFTQTAAKAGIPVKIGKGATQVNAASILGVLSLGINHNDEIVISAEGKNAEAVLDELTLMLSTDLDAA